MNTHTLSREDYDNIGVAADEIGDFLVKYGRVHVTQTKEKYSSARVYCSLGFNCLLNITHPRYMHYGPYPKWLMTIDIYYLPMVVRLLNPIVIPYHKWLYRLAYKKALKKYPAIADNILYGADFSELLVGLGNNNSDLQDGL